MVQQSRATDDLSDITVLTNGYWWHARNASGIGTAAFKVPEGNLHTTFDLVQATVANQPTVLSENNSTQFRMRKQTDPNPSRIVSGAVQAGWTGATYVGGWFRQPDANGDTTGAGTYFSHNNTTGGQGRIICVSGTTGGDNIGLTCNATGVGGATSRNAVASTLVGAGYHWLEWIFDPLLVLGGSPTADRGKIYSDLVLQTRIVTESVGAMPASIFDGNAFIAVACGNASASDADTIDWASCFYCNGIPSVADRRRMAGLYPPRTITF
jgi:hypothetical protein